MMYLQKKGNISKVKQYFSQKLKLITLYLINKMQMILLELRMKLTIIEKS